MNDLDSLREKTWRGKLTPAEEARLREWLAEHPEVKGDLETDSRLTKVLEKLPDVPVPSNFTARVLKAIEREDVAVSRPSKNRLAWLLRSLLPKAAVVAVIFGVGLLSYHDYQERATAKRAELVQGVKVVTGVPSLSPEILQDFDTIRQISTTPGPDPELIAFVEMMSHRRKVFLLAAALTLLCSLLRAQVTPGASSAKSPVALFRELLAMTPEQCNEAIAIRPPDIQKRILAKLDEYRLLPDELRELRLRETELRWYLRPLMDEPKANRAPLLAEVPQELRAQVEERLQMWDILPPGLQEQFKDNDLIASYFAQTGAITEQQRQEMLQQISPERRDELQKGLASWKQMSETEHQKMLAGFNKFFELTPEQKEKTLDAVSDDERQTLSAYESLTPKQRAQCVSSFEKFARMGVAERQQFLKNADRWREMTPKDREKWRQVVNVAPIMPPTDFQRQPASTNRSLMQEGTAVATN